MHSITLMSKGFPHYKTTAHFSTVQDTANFLYALGATTELIHNLMAVEYSSSKRAENDKFIFIIEAEIPF